MTRPAKLVHDIDPVEAITRRDKRRGIPRKGHRIAGHMRDAGNAGRRNFCDLCDCTRAGRINDHTGKAL